MYSRAGSTPPMSSTTRSLPATISSKSPCERVRTPVISGRCPTAASIAAAHVPGEDVARLAVLAGDRADRLTAQTVRDLGLVAGAVQHRPQVVRHPAVDGHVRADAGDVLDRTDSVDRHPGVSDDRAAGLAQNRHVVGRALE